MKNLQRATQMNAIYLEREIHRALSQILHSTFPYIPMKYVASHELELNTILALILWYSSVYKNGHTFGQQLLSIQYEDMSKLQKYQYLMIGAVHYLHRKIELVADTQSKTAKLMSMFQCAILLMHFSNVSHFLQYGQKPHLIDRILNLQQTSLLPESHKPSAEQHKYLGRELLWSGFIELFVHILPSIKYHKVKRHLTKVNVFSKRINETTADKSSHQLLINSKERFKCGYCGQKAFLPHHMNCSHIFCYVCLQGNLVADSQFQCPQCEHSNDGIIVCEKLAFQS